MARQCSISGCCYSVFRTDKNTGKPYCGYHWKQHSTDIDKRSFGQKFYQRMKERNKQNGSMEKSEQDLWFENIANTVIKKNPYCWETGDFISEPDYRAATAHIFPKAIFPSVATHPLNFLILSPRNGAHQMTERLDKFSKMGVWKIAVERFRTFEPLITEKHKYLNEFRELANKPQELNTDIL